MRGERGTTLLELVLAAAIICMVAAAFFEFSRGTRPFAMRSAAAQFDASMAYAQAVAEGSGNGATVVFDRRLSAQGIPLSGFVLTVYSGRPTAAGALHAVPAPVVLAGGISESRLGGVPFTVFLDSAGHASALRGAVTAETVMTSDPGCPSGESSVTLTISDARASEARTIECNAPEAASPAAVPAAGP